MHRSVTVIGDSLVPEHQFQPKGTPKSVVAVEGCLSGDCYKGHVMCHQCIFSNNVRQEDFEAYMLADQFDGHGCWD